VAAATAHTLTLVSIVQPGAPPSSRETTGLLVTDSILISPEIAANRRRCLLRRTRDRCHPQSGRAGTWQRWRCARRGSPRASRRMRLAYRSDVDRGPQASRAKWRRRSRITMNSQLCHSWTVSARCSTGTAAAGNSAGTSGTDQPSWRLRASPPLLLSECPMRSAAELGCKLPEFS